MSNFDREFKPLVSIVIPVYNGANYMQEAIDSAINQTYQNIEIIVVNDGSNDEGQTEKISLNYGDKIRYFKKENGGVASALNLGIENMKGQYFSWLSHDDVYQLDKIEYQIEILKTLQNKDTILYSSYELINSSSEHIAIVNPSDVLFKKQLDTSLIPLFRGVIHGCSLLIPTRYFKEIGKFDETLRYTQDYRLWFDFLRDSDIKFCDKPLIKSRMHPNQDSKKANDAVIIEGNKLWNNLVNMLSPEEMKITEGSVYAFLRRAAIFLSASPYEEAAKLIAAKAEAEFKNTLVSIVIPFYNRIELTLEAIKSASNQTHQNIEIILVDDGSTDDISLIKKISENDKRIKYYRTGNKGVSAARNYGIDKSSGDYIAFLDSDDLFVPEKIEFQLRAMIDDDCYISHTSYSRIDYDGKHISTINSGELSGALLKRLIHQCTIATPTVIVRASLLRNTRFKENIDCGEDVCLWIDLSAHNKINGIDKPLSMVRFTDNSTVNVERKYFKGVVNILNHVLTNDEYMKEVNDIKCWFNVLLGIQAYPYRLQRIFNTRLLRLFLVSLKQDGIKITFQKVFLKLKRKIKQL